MAAWYVYHKFCYYFLKLSGRRIEIQVTRLYGVFYYFCFLPSGVYFSCAVLAPIPPIQPY